VDLSVVVAKDSPIENVEDLEGLLTAANDESNTEKLLSSLSADKGMSPQTEEVDSYQTAYETIQKNAQKGMVLNSAYLSLLELLDADFSDKVKTIYTTSLQETVETTKEKEDKETDTDIFNVYISGIDSYGSISAVSRSDVNLIMTVNRKTNKILITTTPRDSYVQIAGGGNNQYDKLTHSGIYGINSSIQTLENLYNIDIDYYVRLNFTSFLQIIDLIGGVEVYNDQAFTSHIGKYDFPVGNLTLDSERALAFVRERYSLSDGDNDRGKNQEKVLAAVIKKLTSGSALTNLPSIVTGVSESVQTNMPLATLMTLVNDQIDNKNDYEIASQAVEGTGSTGQLTSYAMPNATLYMLSLDSNSLTTAKQAINDVMEGN
jgi:LCP family protein required for cell wall assembly